MVLTWLSDYLRFLFTECTKGMSSTVIEEIVNIKESTQIYFCSSTKLMMRLKTK